MATNSGRLGSSVNSQLVSSPFLGGLNTELSGIVDSTDFTKDECNMMIRADGSRSRRPGVDYEENFRLNNELIDTTKPNLAFNSIEWLDINSPDEAQTYAQIPYIVVQIGSKIIFYKNHGQPYSQDELEWTLDLLEESSPGVYKYKLDGKSDIEVATERCKFTVAYGCLFITSKAIKPIRLRSAQDETIPHIVETFPYCTVSCTAYRSSNHSIHDGRMGTISGNIAYYEFYINDVLIGHFDVGGYQGFPNSYVLAQSFNNISPDIRKNITATPFEQSADSLTNPIGNYGWTPNDWITFNASSMNERGTKIKIVVFGWYVKATAFPPINIQRDIKYAINEYEQYMAGGSSAYTNTAGLTLKIRDTDRGAKDYLSTESNPQSLSYAHLYNLQNQGWTPELIAQFYYKSSTQPSFRFFPGNNLAQQYLKDKKTDPFKPEDLINMTFGNTPAARGHYQLDFFNQDRNSIGSLKTNLAAIVTRINQLSGTTYQVSDLRDAMGVTPDPLDPDPEETIASTQVPVVKPRRDYVADICTYAGRIFYLCGDVLLYSQMISEDISKADKCYTEADPTSEEMSDIVETDGGLISLPDIGDGVKLAQYGQYLFIFGSRGNAVITGTANNIFTATAYSAGSLGAVPTQAPDSFVNTEFGVFYWGTTGITLLGQGEGGLAAQDISTPKILTWYGKLSNIQHKWCKGVYSSAKKKIYWFYPSDEEKPRRLDCCLVYDIQRGSFAPQKIATGFVDDESGEYTEPDLPEVVSGLPLKVPFKSVKEYPIITEGMNPDYEITVDTQEESAAAFNGYRDAEQVANKETAKIGLTSSASSTSGCGIIGIDFSILSAGMNVGETKEIMRFKDCDTLETLMTVVLEKSSNNFSVNYTGYAPLVPFDGNEKAWFVIATDWNNLSPASTYIGFVPENTVIGSGYTAKDVPSTIISYCRNRYISGYTKPYIICEFNSEACGDLEDNTLYATVFNPMGTVYNFVRNSSDTSFVSDQSYYYIKSGEDTVYTAQGDVMVPFGTIRNTYTNYIDCVKTEGGSPNYLIYTYNGVDYYTMEKSYTYSEHPAFFTRVNGVLILYGFGNDIPSTSSATITSLDGQTTFTATYAQVASQSSDPYIVVIERYPSIDTYKKYIVSGQTYNVLADDPIDSEEFTYESSVLVCLDVANQKITFGDFRNNLLKDWTAGDWNGDGYNYNSYLISHPMNSTDTAAFTGKRKMDLIHTKNMPYLITYFRRTETGELTTGELIYPSGCQGSILWDWRTSGVQGKWSSPTELYRPRKKTLFENGYIINKTNIRGLGRAYQVKLESDEAKQFILEGLVYDLKNDGRI